MAKRLPPSKDGIPEDFQIELDLEVERQVNRMVTYAEQIFAGIPDKIADRLRAIQIDWSQTFDDTRVDSGLDNSADGNA